MPGLPDLWAGIGLAGVALLFAVSWQPSASAAGSPSITTAIAALATFALGALAARGHAAVALTAAVVVALLLSCTARAAAYHQGTHSLLGVAQ